MTDLVPKDHAEAIALFRGEIIGSLTRRELDRGELSQALAELSEQRLHPHKERPLVGYLTRAEIEAILHVPDRTTWAGRRDHALLLLLYNTGARVSEVASLERAQIELGPSACVRLHGKGRKQRSVPLRKKTVKVLRS
jgi:site-specific recombinase XerD